MVGRLYCFQALVSGLALLFKQINWGHNIKRTCWHRLRKTLVPRSQAAKVRALQNQMNPTGPSCGEKLDKPSTVLFICPAGSSGFRPQVP